MAAHLRHLVVLCCALAVAAVPAMAVPTVSVLPEPLRVFPEPLMSVDYIQFTADPVTGTSQYRDGIAELADRYPEIIRVDDIGDLVDLEAAGVEEALSVGRREIPVITVTDFDVPDEGKKNLYISMAIHGVERAGLEGSLRFIEDLGIAWSEDPDGYVMANGDPDGPFYTELTLREVLARARLVFVNLNPDGWAAGDTVAGGASFKRGNDSGDNLPALGGLDLNRQWPTTGWARTSGGQYDTMSQPEARLGRELIETHLGIPDGSADLHGQLDADVILAMMFPAGQFDPLFLEQQVQLAEAIKHNVNYSVFPGAAGLLDGREVQPAEYHTAYDAIGYDDSGFQGDYLVQLGSLNLDHEYIFSHVVPNTVFVPPLTQVHVDTTRELLRATIVTTIIRDEITYTADVGGSVAYVHNPEVLTEEGAAVEPGFGHPQEPYTSTSMRYWEDLAQYTTAPVTPITSEAVAAGADLSEFATVVVTDRDLPRHEDTEGVLVEPDRTAFWSNLRTFAEQGGNLVLTDRALQGLADMEVVPDGAVSRTLQYAGSVQNIDRSHDLLDGVGGVIGQTYFEVPLGFPVTGGNRAPAWRVTSSAWEAAGGTTAATAGGASQTALGTLGIGEGRIAIFGAVLPDASQAFPHPRGLADYAVTYAGNAILVNAATWTR